MTKIRDALNNVGRHSCGTGVRDDERLWAWMKKVTEEVDLLGRELGDHSHPISGFPSSGLKPEEPKP